LASVISRTLAEVSFVNEGRPMSTEALRRQIELATLFLRRLLGLPPDARATITIPGYQDEYYVEATLQVRTLMQGVSRDGESGTPALTVQMQEFAVRAERALERAGITGELGSVAAEAVRAILVWPLANAQPWASSVYQPFDAVIPYREREAA
jgi:hypothetical protein